MDTISYSNSTLRFNTISWTSIDSVIRAAMNSPARTLNNRVIRRISSTQPIKALNINANAKYRARMEFFKWVPGQCFDTISMSEDCLLLLRLRKRARERTPIIHPPLLSIFEDKADYGLL
jgi:hypothetical protein